MIDFKEIEKRALIKMLLAEVDELKDALKKGNHTDIIRECADVSNFSMFIADKYNRGNK